MPLVELGTCGDQQHEWDAAGPVDEMIEKVDERRVCPVQVLDHEHEWSRRGDQLEEPLPRAEQLFAGNGGSRCLDADKRLEPHSKPLAV